MRDDAVLHAFNALAAVSTSRERYNSSVAR